MAMQTGPRPPSICDELPSDCWSIEVKFPESVSELPIGEGGADVPRDCWQIYSTQEECWQISGYCPKQTDPDFPIRDLEEHRINKVFAIHISHNILFCAVEFDTPDNEMDDTYLDVWGGCNTQQEDGRWVYYPRYKAIEIVSVFDDIGSLDHQVHIDSFGYRYITMDHQDIVFSVTYKMAHNFRIIRGTIGFDFAGGETYLDHIEESVEKSPDLIGEGCMLTQHESTTNYTDIVIFRGKDGSVFTMNPSDLVLTVTGTTDINYMLNLEYGMKAQSGTRFNFATDSGEADAYPLNIYNLENSFARSVMQNETQTIGFAEWNDSILNEDVKLLQSLVYLWLHDPGEGTWTGTGQTGHVVAGNPANPDIYYTRNIPYIPNPIPPTNQDPEDDSLRGMRPSRDRLDDGHRIPTIAPMNDKMLRMCIGENFIIASTREGLEEEDPYQPALLFLAHSPWQGTTNVTMHIYKVCDVEGLEDYCYFNNYIYVADGTSQIKSYSTFNML